MKEAMIKEMSLVVLPDGTKTLNGCVIPDRKRLKIWISKHHPEYLKDCIKNGEFKE